MAVLGCSTGGEAYSFHYTVKKARPDLQVCTEAVDINARALETAEAGVYPRDSSELSKISPEERSHLFVETGDNLTMTPEFREGLFWHVGDVGDPNLASALGLHDIVVANRFLCHMPAGKAERCLRNIATMVRPEGYLFVTGIDLDIRERVSSELGWEPVEDLLEQICEGDPTLRISWPLRYWAVEPINRDYPDWKRWYARVFRLPRSTGFRLY